MLLFLTTFTVALPTADPAGGQPRSPAQGGGAPRLTLLRQVPWARPGEELRLALDVSGEPAGAVVSMFVHQRLRSRSAFVDTLEGEGIGEEVATWPQQALDAIPRTGDGSIELNYPIGPGGADLTEEGVYPVTVSLADASGDVLTQLVTYLLLLPTRQDLYPPLSVAALVEVGGPAPALQPDGSVSLDDEALERVSERAQALTSAGDVALSVAPLPETLDALAELGSSGLDLLQSLQIALAGPEVLARPYVDVDPSALRTAGLLDQLPTGSSAGAQTVRTRLNHEPTGGIWITGSTIGRDDVAVLRVPMAARAAVLPQDAFAGLSDGEELPEGPVPAEPVQLEDGGPLAMVVDEGLSNRLQGNEGALDAQRFLAELTTIWLTRPSVERGVVVRIPGDSDIDPELVSTALQGLSLSGGEAVRPVRVSQLFDELDPMGSSDEPTLMDLAPDGSGGDISSLGPPLRRAWTELTGLAGTLADNAQVASLQRSLMVALGESTPDSQRRSYVGRVDRSLDDMKGAVSAAGITITLTARSGNIPLTLVNGLQQPVTVTVTLSSSQLEFPEGNRFVVTIPAAGQFRQDVRVRTRTSGAFPLDVEITSPDESIVLDEATITVRSTTVSGVGLALSGGAGLFLLIWWARHWRSARRARRRMQPPATPGTPPAPGAPGVPAPPPPQPVAPHDDGTSGPRTGPATVARHASPHRHRLLE